MGDEEEREAELVLEVLEEVDDLGLDRDVEGAHRLVGHDEIGLEHECARDADALALAAGEGMREAAVRAVSGRPTRTSASRTRLRRSARRPDSVRAQGLGDDILDLHARVERCVRVLEDHLRTAAERLQLPARERCEILPVEQNAAFLGLVQA